MAALIRNIRQMQSTLYGKYFFNEASLSLYCRSCYSVSQKKYKKDKEDKKDKKNKMLDRYFDFQAESIASRGFLRSQKPYSPPNNVTDRVLDLCSDILNTSDYEASIGDAQTKFSLLSRCAKDFNHHVPNSLLHKITTIGELLVFYCTPVDTRVPLDRMKTMNLPKNLHVQYNYTRFHPETDTMFGGISAFPGESTIISGLKYKKKYHGYRAKSLVKDT